MKIIKLIIICLISINVFAQHCEDQQKITEDYTEDAKILSLREIHADTSHQYSDSIYIPADLVKKYTQLLSVIYNIDNEATDSVFNQNNIHTFHDIPYKAITMNVDTSYNWVNNYLQDSLVSGNSIFDTLMQQYNFKLHSFFHLSSITSLTVTTTDYLNIFPLVDSLKTIAGLNDVEASGSWAGDGNDIEVFTKNDTTFVQFSIGWGDCPAGCTNRHFWKFAVIDCQGVYLGSFGDAITDIKNSAYNYDRVYPNPFDHYIHIKNHREKINSIDIYNMNGVKIRSVENVSGPIDLSQLQPGTYIFNLHTKNNIFSKKMIKW
ncbi:MAG: T9SS type A sorting domain-containing protein [Bacteroidetes bacterium]|jgi:hypothetical protein|nr:T9SS type A sorting domain-containing protein [Bacteroidota bacterium]